MLIERIQRSCWGYGSISSNALILAHCDGEVELSAPYFRYLSFFRRADHPLHLKTQTKNLLVTKDTKDKDPVSKTHKHYNSEEEDPGRLLFSGMVNPYSMKCRCLPHGFYTCIVSTHIQSFMFYLKFIHLQFLTAIHCSFLFSRHFLLLSDGLLP